MTKHVESKADSQRSKRAFANIPKETPKPLAEEGQEPHKRK